MFPGLASRLEKDVHKEYCNQILKGGSNHISKSINVIVFIIWCYGLMNRLNLIVSMLCSQVLLFLQNISQIKSISGLVGKSGKNQVSVYFINYKMNLY